QGQRAQFQLAAKKRQLAQDEGAAVVMEPSSSGDGGTIFVSAATIGAPTFGPQPPNAPRPPRAWDRDAPKIVPQVVVAAEHYNRMVRMIQQGEKLKATVDLAVQFHDNDLM